MTKIFLCLPRYQSKMNTLIFKKSLLYPFSDHLQFNFWIEDEQEQHSGTCNLVSFSFIKSTNKTKYLHSSVPQILTFYIFRLNEIKMNDTCNPEYHWQLLGYLQVPSKIPLSLSQLTSVLILILTIQTPLTYMTLIETVE